MKTLGSILTFATGASVTSWIDFAITVAVCITIVLSVVIIVYGIRNIVSDCRPIRKEINGDGQHQPSADVKLVKWKDRYDAAWRFFDMCWKLEHPEPAAGKDGKPDAHGNTCSLTKEDRERYAEAWSVIREYIGAEPVKQDNK